MKKTKKELEKEIKEIKNKYLMALADLENYKKRKQKEFEELAKYLNERLLIELIPILDNFERALKVAHKDSAFSKGLKLIYKQLLDTLKKEGMEAFESVGKEFDPRCHEAVSTIPSKDRDGIIIDEMEKGYRLKDKLARPAKVVVAKKTVAAGSDV